MEKICVAVRVRPSSTEEVVNGFQWKVESNRISLHRSHGTPISGVSFAFGKLKSELFASMSSMILSFLIRLCRLFVADHVFDQESSNATIYEHLTKDVINAAVEGFNGEILFLIFWFIEN